LSARESEWDSPIERPSNDVQNKNNNLTKKKENLPAPRRSRRGAEQRGLSQFGHGLPA
jgi:hypothetical protein